MMRFMQGLGLLLCFATTSPVLAQPGGAPADCHCNLVGDTWGSGISNQYIGNATTNAYCQVLSGGLQCRIVGTITLNFSPTGNQGTHWTITAARWGLPDTDITGSLPIGATYTYTHPSSATEYCDHPPTGGVASLLEIFGFFVNNNVYAQMTGYRVYFCLTT